MGWSSGVHTCACADGTSTVFKLATKETTGVSKTASLRQQHGIVSLNCKPTEKLGVASSHHISISPTLICWEPTLKKTTYPYRLALSSAALSQYVTSVADTRSPLTCICTVQSQVHHAIGTREPRPCRRVCEGGMLSMKVSSAAGSN